ncbi:uncharacterized protein BDZ99DRAFT_457231 [Mytilinidion resinicola]|uniref:Uncharacterized protein n=1 Tax=Mytilinidion resinicola TaxID=574789 RepID=A0A6A6Z9M3_9PEZI|nr:uncharacterized protein BDZ99DRAFT_457231 [Mytilinidion resinicola]KAF2817508.1 hypothetical protein BDZ99DRAFT_457231 [Mytilinidion resinicola]
MSNALAVPLMDVSSESATARAPITRHTLHCQSWHLAKPLKTKQVPLHCHCG